MCQFKPSVFYAFLVLTNFSHTYNKKEKVYERMNEHAGYKQRADLSKQQISKISS